MYFDCIIGGLHSECKLLKRRRNVDCVFVTMQYAYSIIYLGILLFQMDVRRLTRDEMMLFAIFLLPDAARGPSSFVHLLVTAAPKNSI